jgi:3-dehydroquinate synthase
LTSSLQASFQVTYSYQVHFTRNFLQAQNPFFKAWWRQIPRPPKICIIVDAQVDRTWPNLQNQLADFFLSEGLTTINYVCISGGEPCKSEPQVLEELLQTFHSLKLCRHSLVFAIGGGALLDAVGYASSICHRGLRHVRMPTTVLSQNDSGVGVKNGVNAFGKKNFLGTFNPPEAVICDFAFLDGLSPQDRSSGYAEALKVALLKDPEFFLWIKTNAAALRNGAQPSLEKLIIRCAELHLQHITQGGDPFEKGSSRPLDFGHWSAHKLEQLSHYQLSHGQAVALGICCDCRYAQFMGWLDNSTASHIIDTVKNLGLPTQHVLFQQQEQLFQGLDEFREHLGGQLTITSIKNIGECFDLHEVQPETMIRAFQASSLID